jgi:hypothetical protein
MRDPRAFRAVADVAGQPVDAMGPCVKRRVGHGAAGQSQAHTGGRHPDRADGAQGCSRFRIESLEGLRKTTVSLPSHRPQEVLRSLGVGRLDFLDRPIEVAEDPADLFLQEAEARGSEPVDGLAARLSKFLRHEAIGRFQVRFDARIRERHQP